VSPMPFNRRWTVAILSGTAVVVSLGFLGVRKAPADTHARNGVPAAVPVAVVMRSNPGITQAEAHFRQARALVRQDRAAYFRTITASTSIARSRPGAVTGTGIQSGTTRTEYSLSADASWEADLWGRTANQSPPAHRLRRRRRRTSRTRD
jgi:hypothetical protein